MEMNVNKHPASIALNSSNIIKLKIIKVISHICPSTPRLDYPLSGSSLGKRNEYPPRATETLDMCKSVHP